MQETRAICQAKLSLLRGRKGKEGEKGIINYSRGEGGVLPSNRLMGVCGWMGSHFHDRIDYDGVPFSIEILEWGRIFSGLGVGGGGGRIFWQVGILGIKNIGRFAVQI